MLVIGFIQKTLFGIYFQINVNVISKFNKKQKNTVLWLFIGHMQIPKFMIDGESMEVDSIDGRSIEIDSYQLTLNSWTYRNTTQNLRKIAS